MEKFLEELIREATNARLNSYAPYSEFSVGAAVLANNGWIFTGFNIENASLGLSMCAERVAIYRAISAGCRNFKAMAIIGDTKKPCTPCGACRQVMVEFSPEMNVIMTNLNHEIKIMKAKELLPNFFIGNFHR